MKSNKEFPCDICGSKDAVELPHAREYTNGQPIHICKKCGFVHVKHRRSFAQIADTWSKKIYGKGYTAVIPAVRARQTYVADFIEKHLGLRNKEVCDIGAGEGRFPDIIRQPYYGATTFGIEASARNCQLLGKMGIEHFNGTIEDFLAAPKKQKRQFDIATIMWTLENCQSCREMLAGAWKLLKPGGHVVIATGSRILVPFKKPLYLYLSKNDADTHSFRFSANTLKSILAVSKFKSVHVNRYLDTDYLCIIAKKVDHVVPWQGDPYLDVYNFFERWHVDTQMYYSEK
jgi:2-polyprenyl-3-methyl-5-hydroxy-6-metoxy-1,4-benzoquinol methylase